LRGFLQHCLIAPVCEPGEDNPDESMVTIGTPVCANWMPPPGIITPVAGYPGRLFPILDHGQSAPCHKTGRRHCANIRTGCWFTCRQH